MRVISLLLWLFILPTSANVLYGQRISFTLKKAPVEDAFREIMFQSGFNMLYPMESSVISRKITLTVIDRTLSETLDLCMQALPGLSYSIDTSRRAIDVFLKDPAKGTLTSSDGQQFVQGTVIAENGERLAGINVTVKSTGHITSTDQQGEFRLKLVDKNVTLIISGVNIETYEAILKGNTNVLLHVKTKIASIDEVVVNGYQVIPKERATGSFVRINNEMFNRKMGPDVLSRIDGIASGVYFDRRKSTPRVQINGLYTLSEKILQPLIVVDNFVYEGNLNNLNPLDIESITVLKDAAATSIWGARAGNGVIIVSMKKGKYNQQPVFSFNSNFFVTKKSDLYNIPDISASDYIDLEKYLFDLGNFDAPIGDPQLPLTPAVDILLKQRNGTLTASQATAQLDALGNVDVRKDFEKYIYRNALLQQYAANMSGGKSKLKYFFSAGYDRSFEELKGNDYHKFTLRADNTWQPVKRLQLRVGVGYTHTFTHNNSQGGYGQYQIGDIKLPLYTQLADADGNPLPVNHIYRGSYTDTAGGGKLLDWKYRPLQQLAVNNNTIATDAIAADLDLRYDISNVLTASVKYRNQHVTDKKLEAYNTETFFARNLINNYTQINGNTISYVIPNGPIVDHTNSRLSSSVVRGQLDLNKSWGSDHQLTAIVGSELQSLKTSLKAGRQYASDVNYLVEYHLVTGGQASIPQYAADTIRNTRYLISW